MSTMNWLQRSTCALLVAALSSGASQADAFSLKSTSTGEVVRWMEDDVGFASVRTGDGPKDALLRRALRGALEVWSGASGLTASLEPASENQVRWSGEVWDFDPSFLAVTLTRYEVTSGRIVSTEIVINERETRWADRVLEPHHVQHFDLQNALTHELGHALGLGHSEVGEATMFASADAVEVSKRNLDRDDIEGAQALYGIGLEDGAPRASEPEFTASPFSPEEDAMGCSATAGPGPASWMVLLFSGAAPWLRRRRRASLAVVTLLFALAVPRGASATPTLALTTSSVLERAELLFQGTIVAQHTELRPGDLVVTISTVRIEACLKGACPAVVVVEQLGGEHGELGLMVSGITPLPRQGRVLLAAAASGSRWRLAAEDRGQLYVETEKSGPSNTSESLAAVRTRLESYLAQPPLPAPPSATSTPTKGLLRQ